MSMAAAALLAAGCASSVVNGRPNTPSSSVSSGPDGSGPSSSYTSPSTPTTPVTPTGSLVTNEAGHYRVRMPGTPQRKSTPGEFSGVKFTVHVDTISSPYLALIGEEEFDVDLPVAEVESALTQSISSFASSAGASVVSSDATTFRGRKAREGDLTKDGTHYTLLIVAWSSHRLYFFLAPQGQEFAALTTSFESLA
jgi:hypothetical protein